MSVKILQESCVRALSTAATCQKCADVCQSDAIGILGGGAASINQAACTECGLCVGVCPTAAIETTSETDAALCVEELFCAVKESAVDIELTVQRGLLETFAARVDEANALLGVFGISSKAVIVAQDKGEEDVNQSKRALFRMFTKDGIKAAHDSVKSEEELVSSIDFSLLRAKKIPAKRESFLLAVHDLEPKGTAIEISFTSEKHIDESCDNCSLCCNLCPSGALETTAMKNAIIFSSHLCLRCGLCADVCEKNSISSLPAFAVANFKERKKVVLKKFAAKLCPSCGAVFCTDDDECVRCAKESEDAHELLGL